MIEKIWFDKHPLIYLLWPILWPVSLLFRCISQSRRAQFLSGKRVCYRSPVPVVVVGNITAGGNGKTPVVIWLVERLKQLGFKPGVASRGYGGKAEHYPLLVDEQTSVGQCGDEPKLISRRTGVPVVVDPIRANAVQALLTQGVDLVITDDGLQHYALARDLELVVVDGQRRFGNEQFIPLGPLREGLERLNTVDFVIYNGGITQSSELAMSLKPEYAVNLITGEQRPVNDLGQLAAFAGIGNPRRFFETLMGLGADLVKSQGFADHQEFSASALEGLVIGADNVIMTEKDAVKCVDYAQHNWWYLPVSAYFSEHDEQRLIARIIDIRNSYGSPSA